MEATELVSSCGSEGQPREPPNLHTQTRWKVDTIMDAISIENTLGWKHSLGTPRLDHLNEICQHLWREGQPRNKRVS